MSVYSLWFTDREKQNIKLKLIYDIGGLIFQMYYKGSHRRVNSACINLPFFDLLTRINKWKKKEKNDNFVINISNLLFSIHISSLFYVVYDN